MIKDDVAKAILKAFGVDDAGKSFLEYLGMAIGGEARTLTSGRSAGPQDNVCDALRDVASAIRELANAVENHGKNPAED